jgi:putative two-component system response regulator
LLLVEGTAADGKCLHALLHENNYTEVYDSNSSGKALELIKSIDPDLVLLDLDGPVIDGVALIAELRRPLARDRVPILVITENTTTKLKREALEAGANDFVTKPYDDVEVLLRIRNMLQSRLQTKTLEEAMRIRTSELFIAQLETVHRLALAAEYRDDQTGLHARRVGMTSGRIAESIGCSTNYCQLITEAAALHDVGKIGVPDQVLLKPGRLTVSEWDQIKQHTTIGASILSGSSSPLLQLAEQIALTHHERWDGLGYAGLRGNEIPLGGRIVAVADAFDAITCDRPYRPASTREEAINIMLGERGGHFEPRILDAFLALAEIGHANPISTCESR